MSRRVHALTESVSASSSSALTSGEKSSYILRRESLLAAWPQSSLMSTSRSYKKGNRHIPPSFLVNSRLGYMATKFMIVLFAHGYMMIRRSPAIQDEMRPC